MEKFARLNQEFFQHSARAAAFIFVCLYPYYYTSTDIEYTRFGGFFLASFFHSLVCSPNATYIYIYTATQNVGPL